MKETTRILFIISGALMVLSFCLNFNDFIMGSTPEVVTACISILFAASCCFLSFTKKGRKMSFALITYTGLMAIISLAAFIVSTYRLSADYLLPFVLIVMPPFYGLSLLSGFYNWWLVLFALSALLFIVNLYVSKKADP